MTKYIIEGGVDFYDELYKSLDVVDDNASEETKCLITNMILEEDYVKLKCGHKFNYIPLYNELKKQKKNCNVDNYHANKLLIKCPYCRSFQAELLPEKEGVKPIYSINSMNKNSADFYNYIPVGYFEGTCQLDLSSNNYIVCSAVYVTKLDNGKCYCQAHKYFGMQMYLVELKQKAKEDRAAKLLKTKEERAAKLLKAKQEKELVKQQDKQKAKEEKELAKQQEKQKAKEEKELAKQKKK